MTDPLIRKEQREADDLKLKAFTNIMRESLSAMSKSKGGLNVLRYILHESRFLAPLTYETATGMNTEVLLQNEAKRMMYLSLRAHMDTETVKRVELNEEQKQEDTNAGT